MDNNSFFSIDRLVEFGLGMAVAQQMVQTMNHSMQQMYVPGSMQSMPQPQPVTCYLAIDGQAVGPMSEGDIARLLSAKKITKDTLAWLPGMPTWKPVEQIPQILRVVAMTPPEIPTNL